MSEYQYYEFLAVDRPLAEADLAALRELSTRATITPTSFVNEYHWGDFRGNTRKLMERYYDAHLYRANWGTRQLMLRVPKKQLPLAVVDAYCSEESLDAWTHGGNTILNLHYDPEDGGDWEENFETPLAAVIGVRAELAAGDHRALYLAWLVGLSAWELAEEDEEQFGELEPPVPPGLTTLTGPQQALAAFLKVDPDLLAVAAETSAPARDSESDTGLDQWIAALPDKRKNALLLRLAQGDGALLGAELLGGFRGSQAARREPGAGRRTAAELLDSAHVRRTERRRAQREAAAAAGRRREEQAAALHEAHLLELTDREEQAWEEVGTLIAQKKPAEYDRAVKLLTDLREVRQRAGDSAGFDSRAAVLRDTHRGKPSLMRRFDAAGMPNP